MRIRYAIACAAAMTVGMPLSAAAAGPADATAVRSAHKVETCKGNQLRVSVRNGDAAAGTTYLRIRFRNTGKRCAVRAWPQVGYAGKRGRPVGYLASHPHKHYRTRILRHGQARKVTLGTPAWQNFRHGACWPQRAARLAVYLPSRITPDARHLKKVPAGPGKVCSTRHGRPYLSLPR